MARKVARSKGPQAPAVSPPVVAPPVKLKITLDADAAKLLKLEAFGRGCSLGEVVSQLLREMPRRYILSHRGVGVRPGIEGSDGIEGPQLAEGSDKPSSSTVLLVQDVA